jgi:hypothetical protein
MVRTSPVQWLAGHQQGFTKRRVICFSFGNVEGKMAVMIKKPSERGQSITLFALMLPLMAVFILGLFDYMTTNARAMEAVAAADLSAHAGAQEVRLLPNGKILSDVDAAEEVAYDYFRMQAPSYVQFVDVVCGDSADRPFCRVTARVNSAGYLFASRPITIHAVGYLAWGVTREKH